VLYQWYEFGCAAWGPARVAAQSCRLFLNALNHLSHTPAGRTTLAACEVSERATRRYPKPEFGITHTTVEGALVAVREAVVW
jgi:poly(3-hydroxybutyrate) depolymerase